MGGKPCIRGLRVTIGTVVVGLFASGESREPILSCIAAPANPTHPDTTRASAHHAPMRVQGHIARLAPTIDPARGCRVAVIQFPAAGNQVLPGTVVHINLGHD